MMQINLDFREMLEEIAEDLVAFAVQEAPQDTGDLRDSIRAGQFDPVNNSIDVYIDPGRIGVSPGRKNTKRWNGKLYPELVHDGHKTRGGKSFVSANPFFTRALDRLDISKYGITFRIIK